MDGSGIPWHRAWTFTRRTLGGQDRLECGFLATHAGRSTFFGRAQCGSGVTRQQAASYRPARCGAGDSRHARCCLRSPAGRRRWMEFSRNHRRFHSRRCPSCGIRHSRNPQLTPDASVALLQAHGPYRVVFGAYAALRRHDGSLLLPNPILPTRPGP